jgi:hypothetical protein
VALVLALIVAIPPAAFGEPPEQKPFKPEELEQIVAPIALYPDSLLAQQKEVMDTVQTPRKKAKAEGNLETTKEQKVTAQEEMRKAGAP